MSNTYTCNMCHQTYKKGWTDAEAKKEANELWDKKDLQDAAIVCDDCFKQMTYLIPPAKLQPEHAEEV